jgi:peptidoglycan/LPS O-acetylase OafA/YrhL
LPRPVSTSRAYLPALDGIRAIAVLAVLGYHFGVPWLAGGLLGVGVFFTLSGCLITGILLSAYERTGGLELRRFWVHRARRLLPGLVLMLVVVLGTTALAQRGSLGQRWDQTLAAIFYVSNWTTIAGNVSYFDHFAGPGPLDHLW